MINDIILTGEPKEGNKCKYCDYVSKCSRKCEYNSYLCKVNRSFLKIVEKSYEDILKEVE